MWAFVRITILTENFKLFREAVEYIGAIVNPEEDYKLVETLTINQNVIRNYCYLYFVNIFHAITETK
jgi:hypothetical protein